MLCLLSIKSKFPCNYYFIYLFFKFLGKFVLDMNFVKIEDKGIREEFAAGRGCRSRGYYKHDGDHGCMKMCCQDQDFPIYVRISTQ